MPAAGQEQVLAFLESGGLGAETERIDTHAAIVLLAGDRAFKLKRPVRYSFLDFTTLERREAALRHELELNRRTAPELYLRVLPVTAGPDGLALNGAGPPVEWLLEMRRFPTEARLDRVLAQGGLADAADRPSGGDSSRRSRRGGAPPRPGRPCRVARCGRWQPVRSRRRRSRGLCRGDRPRPRPADPDHAGTSRPAPGGPPGRGAGAPLPRRPAPRQHRAARRPSGAVRLPRVRRRSRLHRPALRPRLPAHGPDREGPPAVGQPTAQSLAGADGRP